MEADVFGREGGEGEVGEGGEEAGGGGGAGGGRGFIPGKAGVDYPDFKTIPATDFTCENFLLPGFYADTFTSCQVTGNRHLVKNSTMTNVFGQALAQT